MTEMESFIRKHHQTVPPRSREETYAFYALRNAADRLMALAPGNRRISMEREAFTLGGFAANGWIEAEDIYSLLFLCSEYNGLVGKDGAAFGVANGTTLNVYQLLLAVNRRAVNGVLYDGDAALRQMANDVFDGINQAGGL